MIGKRAYTRYPTVQAQENMIIGDMCG